VLPGRSIDGRQRPSTAALSRSTESCGVVLFWVDEREFMARLITRRLLLGIAGMFLATGVICGMVGMKVAGRCKKCGMPTIYASDKRTHCCMLCGQMYSLEEAGEHGQAAKNREAINSGRNFTRDERSKLKWPTPKKNSKGKK
jgi:hypothetical protein